MLHRIEKLFFRKDIILNAEWNKKNRPPYREVHLHRHPVFMGNLEDVVQDCCGCCPNPETDEEKNVAAEEDKIYVRGPLTFLKDDPGRQEVGEYMPFWIKV